MADTTSSTPREHPVWKKLTVAKERGIREVNRLLNAGEYERAIRAVRRLQGIDDASQLLRTPDHCFDEP